MSKPPRATGGRKKAVALRKTKTQSAPAPAGAPAAPETLSGKFLKAIGAKPEAKPFRFFVRGADGEFFSKPATAAEALQYANRKNTWRRIA